MTTYYVSSEYGSNTNAGTSENAPLATLPAASNLVRPGDTVEVMNGTYTGKPGQDVLLVTTSGTATAPITFEAAPGQTPIIDSSGAWCGITVEASNVVINGFTVEGDAADYTLAQAQAQEHSTSDPALNGNGITVKPSANGSVPNHVVIENNTVFNEPGGGITVEYADYVEVLNNTVHDNTHWSPYADSGISVWQSENSDTKSGVHDVVSGNISYNNTNEIPNIVTGTITDGEGIILDTNPNYVGTTLVQDNLTFGNSAAGISDYKTNNAVIAGNIAYGNDTNTASAGEGQIYVSQSTGSTVTGNITTPPSGDTLTIRMNEDAWNGDAQFVVRVDGKQVGGTLTADVLRSSGDSGVFNLTGDWGSGAHDVQIQFMNDTWGGTNETDRNLFVNSVAYDGVTYAYTSANLFQNGTANFTVGGAEQTAAGPADTLVVHLSGDAWNGYPQFTLAIDGSTVSTPQTVTASHASGVWQDFAFSGNFGAGAHTVSVQFGNDAYGGSSSTDRNLYVNGIDINGQHVGSGVTALYANGAATFGISTWS